MSNSFEKVKDLVEKGLTIYAACKRLKICSTNFYNKLTANELLELRQTRVANTFTASYHIIEETPFKEHEVIIYEEDILDESKKGQSRNR